MAASMKYVVEKFDGKNSFSLWKVKMKAMLVQQGIQKTLMGRNQLPDTLSESENDGIMEKATLSIQLSLTDEVFREVAEIEVADEL